MIFKVQINVGETIEEIQKRWLKDLEDTEKGEWPEVKHHLNFLTWDLFMRMLSPEGKAMMEDFKRLEEEGPDFIICESSSENAYPPDDGLPSTEQLKDIERLAPQDTPTTPISSLF